MNIEEMIWNGASEEEIAKALAAVRAEKARQEAELRAQEEAKARAAQAKQNNEALKAEGRAYLINALLCYGKAFELLTEDDMDEEDIAELEQAIVKLEQMAPMYIKLYDMQNKLDMEFFKGLM